MAAILEFWRPFWNDNGYFLTLYSMYLNNDFYVPIFMLLSQNDRSMHRLTRLLWWDESYLLCLRYSYIKRWKPFVMFKIQLHIKRWKKRFQEVDAGLFLSSTILGCNIDRLRFRHFTKDTTWVVAHTLLPIHYYYLNN